MHKLEFFSSNPGKLHFELLIHLLWYIKENKTSGLRYYANIDDAPVFDLLRQSSNKTENKLMAFSDSIWKDYPDTRRSTGAYIIFYQGRTNEHGTHVPGTISQ